MHPTRLALGCFLAAWQERRAVEDEAMRFLPALLAALALLAGASLGTAQAAEEVDLALVLAVDVSRSMDFQEQQVQRDGYVQAFRHPDVIKAIRSGPLGRIAVTYVEWSGPEGQIVVAPWTVLDGAASANAFADAIAKAPISRLNYTSISAALGFSADLLARRGGDATRQVIDVSGDGPNNIGPPVLTAREQVLSKGIVINGLPVMLPGRGREPGGLIDLDVYYKNCVIGGPTAFLIPIRAMDEFVSATRRKLILEIAAIEPAETATVIPAATAAPPYDCMIGEKQRQF